MRRGLGQPVVLVWLALVVLAFVQQPGLVTFDTKLDLAVDPGGFLQRALHLWDAENGVGGVNDQAYGYLFPLGPFFLLGDALGVPAWVVQRLWSALLLVVAFEGFRRLVLRVVASSRTVAVLAGLAWALSPRVLTVLGPISAEALPVALLPWVLLPLVVLGGRRPLAAAAWSGVAVLCMGAANATLTVAVLPVPALWILTRPWALRARVRLLALWSAAVVAACAWWVGPLLLLGRYSPPFLDWIESAANTTGPLNALAALRGTTHWVAYLVEGDQGFWPAAGDLVLQPWLVLATGLLAALGLAGLASRTLPERRFLVLTLVLGLITLLAGRVGALDSPLSAQVRDLLDGVLSPLRNVHKTDPLVRLPLLLGLAHAVQRLTGRPDGGSGTSALGRRLLAGTAVVALLAVAVQPALAGRLRPGPGFEAVPDYWSEAAERVADGDGGRTLLLPASGFGRYTWGRPVDEPLQALAESPWTVRNQVPLTSAGSVRVLDAVEQAVASGRGSAALADLLRRSGISTVVVRNDLDLERSGAVHPLVVRSALERSPGLRRTGSVGPVRDVGGSLDGRLPALDLYAVDGEVPGATAVAVADVPVVSGGPEDLLTLLEAGVLPPDRPAVLTGDLGDDADAPAGPRLLTDGLQRRETSFGRVSDALGPVLSLEEGFRADRAVHQRLPFDADGHQTTVRYEGVRTVSASSSASDPEARGGARTALSPWAALDGSTDTAWVSATDARTPVGQWWEVTFPEPVELGAVGVRWVTDARVGPQVSRVEVQTDAGAVEQDVAAAVAPDFLEVPPEPTTRLRLTVLETVDDGPGQVGLREVVLPGLEPARSLLLPDDVPAAADGRPRAPEAVVLRAGTDPVSPCVRTGDRTRCDPARFREGEEPAGLDRVFTLPVAGRYEITGTVLARPGAEAQRLFDRLERPGNVRGSSSLSGDLGVGPQAAFDGDPTTPWVPDPGDDAPRLDLELGRDREVTGVRLLGSAGSPTARVSRLLVRGDDERREVSVGPDGVARFAPITTSSLQVTVLESEQPEGEDDALLEVGELELLGDAVPPVAAAAGTGAVCGFGPSVVVDGRTLTTAVEGELDDLRLSRPLTLRVCGDDAGPLRLGPGEHRVEVRSTAEFAVRSAVLADPTAVEPAVTRSAEVVAADVVTREVAVGRGPEALLALPESANEGWQAELDGERLRPLTVDGWQQGFVLPAGQGGTVRLSFAPDSLYRTWLVVGGVVAAALVVFALLLVRRPALGRRPEPPVRSGRDGATLPLVVGGLFLASGPVGAAAAVAGRLAARWRGLAPLVAALLASATALAAARTTSAGAVAASSAAPVQALALLAAGLAVGAAVTRHRSSAAPAAAVDRFATLPLQARTRRAGHLVAARWAAVAARFSGGRAVLPGAAAVLAAAFVWRAWWGYRTTFAHDDFLLAARVAQGVDPDVLLEPASGHLLPLQLLVVAVAEALGPLNHPLAMTAALLTQLLIGVLLLRLLLSLFGRRPLVLVPLALYALSPLTVTGTLWWTAALQVLPLNLALVLALHAHVRYVRTRRRRSLVAALAAVALGLGFTEKALIIPPLLGAVTVLLLADGSLRRRLSWSIGRHRVAWAAHLALLTGYLALFLGVVGAAGGPLPGAGSLRRFAEELGEAFAVGLASGPWRAEGPGPFGLHAVPAEPWGTLAVLLLVGVVVATIVRNRGRALRAWLLLAGYTAVTAGAVAVTRLDALRPDIARESRYLVDAVLVAAVVLGAALMPLRSAGTEPAQTGATADRPPPADAPGARRSVRRTAGRALALAAAVVWTVGCLVTTAALGGRAVEQDADAYLATLRAELAAQPDASLFDSRVPPELMAPVLGEAASVSTVAEALRTGHPFDEPAREPLVADEDGRLRPVGLLGPAESPPGPLEDCGYALRAGTAVTVPLTRPLGGARDGLRLEYYSGTASLARVEVGEQVLTVRFEAGVGSLLLRADEPASEVVVRNTAPGTTVCLTGAATGVPAPVPAG